VTALICQNALMLIAGPNSHQSNKTRLPVYIAHTPAGASSQNMAHFGQAVNSGKFQMYDYGSTKNRQHYGQPTPPQYDLSQIEVPTYIFYSDDDWLAPKSDVEGFIPKLRNVVKKTFLRQFNHLDFIWGMRATEEIYWPIIRHIDQQLND